MENTHDKPIDSNDPEVQRVVRDKIRHMVARHRLPFCDREDFGQDLWARVWPRLAAFVPGRAPLDAFLTLIVRRCAINLLARYWRQERHRRVTMSLNRTTRHGTDEVELAQTIGHREYDARRGRHPRDNQELAELALDLKVLLDHLPEDLRALAEELMVENVTQVARRSGRSRSTVQNQVNRLRRIAERNGLRDFLRR